MRVEYYWYSQNKNWAIWAHSLSYEESLVSNLLNPDPNECCWIVPNTEEVD